MESTEESANNKIRWNSETNWVVAHGSLEASVVVDSFEDPIEEPDPDSTARRPPLAVKPPLGPDTSPCEIKILFEQKHEISQIYVRSTARTFEVYYARSPHSGDEYLCTVRCGVAERDEKVLQVACFEDGSEDREEFSSGDTCVSSEDDWVKIKEPEGDVKANRVNTIQDYYEATAQLSDVDPCSVLTIRLLSLQDKNVVYVDEIYIFASQVQSSVTGNEEALAGSSAQNSLMAMFVPALLQMSKSSSSRGQDKSASDELFKDDKIESGLRRPDTSESVSGENQVNDQYTKPEELDKSTTDTDSVLGHTSETKCADHADTISLPAGHLERALEQLTSRASRVEDICLRFEERLLKPIEKMEARLQHLELQLVKLADSSENSSSTQWSQISEGLCLKFEENLLKPIENMEARLQHVEVQLEKLAQNSNDSCSMHGKKFSAPIFSCSESNLSSSYNRGTPYSPSGASEIGNKDFSGNNLPAVTNDLNRIPSLIVTAPEFSHGEDNEDNESLDNPSNTNQKKTRSVDHALAAALSGFLSTAKTHIESSSGSFDAVDQEVDSLEFHESCENEEVSDTKKGKRESLQYTPMLVVKAPDFISEETSAEDHLNHAMSALEMDSVSPKDRDDHADMNAPSLIAELCDRESNKSIHGSESATNGNNFPTVSDDGKSSDLGYKKSNEYSEQQHITDNSIKMDTVANSVRNLAKNKSETEEHQIHDELKRIDDSNLTSQQVSYYGSVDDVSGEDFILERCFKEDNLHESLSSRASLLDFEFPILEVKFSFDTSETTTMETPLETLLDEMSRLNIDASPTNATADEDFSRADSNFVTIHVNETEDFIPSDNLLLDLGVSDETSDSHYVISTNNSGVTVSLI